jgi:L-threonylcarbamoyladenylate synthase
VTRLIVADGSERPIAEAARLIRNGGLVAFPTETVYGLGADATNPAALARIFSAKERPTTDPLIVHMASIDALIELTREVPPLARRLAAAFWPGPLTLVVPRARALPTLLASGRNTVALRVPAHPLARSLISAAGVPVAAPSANRFSRPSPTTAAHVLDDLAGRIDAVLDGGPTNVGVESTVVDCTGSVPQVLRPGAITLEQLRRVVGTVEFAPRYVADAAAALPAPGTLSRHYAPRAELWLYRGPRQPTLERMRDDREQWRAAGIVVGGLIFGEDEAAFGAAPWPYELLGGQRDPATVANRLFAALRAVDGRGVDRIIVRSIAGQGLWLAIDDRLVRAADGRVVTLEPAARPT